MAVPTDRWSLKLFIFLCFTFSTKKCMSFFLLLFFHSFTLSQWWDPSQFWESRPPWCVPPSPPRPGACDPIWGVVCSIHVGHIQGVQKKKWRIEWLWPFLVALARVVWPHLRSRGIDFWWQWGWVIGVHNLCHDNRQLVVLAMNCYHSVSKINCN